MAQRPDAFTDSEVNTALSFFDHAKSRVAESVYHDFLRILIGFSTGEIPDPREATDRVYEFLQGHPDLVRRFDAFFAAPEDKACQIAAAAA